MKIMINDTVMFRYGDSHLYGEILKKDVVEEEVFYTIQAGDKTLSWIPQEDILRAYGLD